jgi:hypothetical protein
MYSTTPVAYSLRVVVPASAGTALLGSKPDQSEPGSPPVGPSLPGGNPELVVRQFAPQPQTFAAPGLTLGVRHVWFYEFHFPGLQ